MVSESVRNISRGIQTGSSWFSSFLGSSRAIPGGFKGFQKVSGIQMHR